MQVHNRGGFRAGVAVQAFVWLTLAWMPLQAQELEPRSLTNVPVGWNFALLGYGYTQGDILLDPAVPIEDLNAKLHTVLGGYVRAIDFFGMSAKVDVVVPYADGDWTGALSGRDSSRATSGFGDPRMRLSVNFSGAPALRATEFAGYQQRTITGASLQVIAPLGQYDPKYLINLGSNRWAFRPQMGVSKILGYWILESYAAAWLFTTNPDFWGGNELKQRPLGAVKVHAIYTMPKRQMWMTLDGGYAFGGRTIVNGEEKDTYISTFRLGVTFAFPLARRHTLRITGATGIRHQRGPEFEGVAAFYQYRWGDNA